MTVRSRRRSKQTNANWKGACYCDYGFHLTLSGEVPVQQFGELAEAMQDGHASIKIFTTDIRPGHTGRMVKHGHIWEALKIVAAQGGIAAIHAEDNDIVMFMYEKLMRENRVGFEHMAEVHNTLSEELSFNRVIRLAENVEGAALYMVHVSAATGVAALAASRARGFPMYGETLHQYLMYNAEDYKKPGGQMYHTYPSLKYPEDQKRLWEATNHGAIQVIATDELCCPLRIKLQGSRIDDTTGGNSGVEPRVALMYTQHGDEARLHAGAFRRHGLDQRREDHGALSAQGRAGGRLGRRHRGAADRAWRRPSAPWTCTRPTTRPGKAMSSPPGRASRCCAARSSWSGAFFGDLKQGEFLPRKVADEIRSRPAVAGGEARERAETHTRGARVRL